MSNFISDLTGRKTYRIEANAEAVVIVAIVAALIGATINSSQRYRAEKEIRIKEIESQLRTNYAEQNFRGTGE